MENYAALLEYKQEHQHCRVPQRYPPNRPLGYWVYMQRANGREALSSEQQQLLDAVGFAWETKDERHNRLWQENYARLVNYRNQHGDCCVPRKYKVDPAFGKWVHDQRTYRKQGLLRKDREDQLTTIGFTWSLRKTTTTGRTDYVDCLWHAQFEKLQAFRKRWGHCLVPGLFEEDPSLGRWVRCQRTLFQNGQLRPDRKQFLETIDFVFMFSNATDQGLEDRHWNTMYQHLVDFQSNHGHTDLPARYQEYGLGEWVRTQRRNKSSLDEQRKKQLDAIGFSWSSPRNKLSLWHERFEELHEYRKLHGTHRVSKKDNLTLATWVYRQRSRIQKGALSPEEAEKLESIGFE